MINLYKNISLDIIDILNEDDIDNEKLEYNIEKRQKIIDSLNSDSLKYFKNHYKNSEIIELDNKIKSLLEEKIIEVRKELNLYRVKKSVNAVYVNMNKNNLNIFSKKV
ncbi:flagellar protein FliT [Clostridium sp. Ade.TY]|uniref:flagellar protein FliT n=1 Tax=Clostridium sp. Ade.TY TaxID=1391647 RepID=UPI00041B96DE|nr:flagellar protein FliT [Clostridium sp. Ade.TY]